MATRIRIAFFAGLGFLIVSGVVLPSLHHVLKTEPPPPLGRFGTLRGFTLEERGGETLTLEKLRGKVWVASFFFSYCPTICPSVLTELERLQSAISHLPPAERERVRLVSISVDPERDSVARLAEYASLYRADPDGWYFVRGERDAVYALIQNEFLLSVPAKESPTAELIHSTKLALVDANGTVRAYYDGLESGSRAALLRDIRRLLQER